MKKITKQVDPSLLAAYRAANPNRTWDHCKKSQSRRNQIQKQLREDQGNLCAYCEINLLPENPTGASDFRVEHFHPKSDNSTGHNCHLDWQNLLACCHGGSRPDIVDAANRSSSPDHSCDVPKDDNNWDADILNPLEIPPSPCLFQFDRASGQISVNQTNCNSAAVDPDKAKNTITRLRLDAPRLQRLRKAELSKINDLLQQYVSNGMSLEAAREKLAKALMKKDTNSCWPKFFSALRAYLGKAAEQQLIAIGYSG